MPGHLTTCPMCWRKHRGDGLYCAPACEVRAATPPTCTAKELRSRRGYLLPKEPKPKD